MSVKFFMKGRMLWGAIYFLNKEELVISGYYQNGEFPIAKSFAIIIRMTDYKHLFQSLFELLYL